MAYGKTKKWMIGGAALAGTAVLTAALWQGLTLRRYALHTDKLSAPVRLLLLTDLHSTFYGRAQRGLLSAIQAQTPDAVLLAGDMADDSRGDAGVDALMSALGGAYPCCYVSGNHEVRTGCLEALKRRFRSWGITVLEGSGTLLATPGGTLRICGVDDPSAFAGESGWLEQFRACQALTGDSRYTVLLSHRPERTECYRDSGFDLVVSGHAHGGQVRLPGMINGLFAPHQGAFPDYAGGLYALGSTTLVVSRGLCRNLLPRVFNPPELVALDLLPAEDKAQAALEPPLPPLDVPGHRGLVHPQPLPDLPHVQPLGIIQGEHLPLPGRDVLLQGPDQVALEPAELGAVVRSHLPGVHRHIRGVQLAPPISCI